MSLNVQKFQGGYKSPTGLAIQPLSQTWFWELEQMAFLERSAVVVLLQVVRERLQGTAQMLHCHFAPLRTLRG